MTETKDHAAMLFDLAEEIRREEGCVTESADRVEAAAGRLVTLSEKFGMLVNQRAELRTALLSARKVIARDRKSFFDCSKSFRTGKATDPRDLAVLFDYDLALNLIDAAMKRSKGML
jgi:hypothetical protein